jgi:PRC-barrel domain protein
MTEHEGPDAAEAQAWVGGRLDDLGGTAVGKVDGFFVDEETGRPEWLVIRLGRFGQQGLVPAREAVGVAGRVWVPYRREAIKGAPKTGTKSPLTREAEIELLKHFGAGGDAGRTAELSARGFEAITASPAS